MLVFANTQLHYFSILKYYKSSTFIILIWVNVCINLWKTHYKAVLVHLSLELQKSIHITLEVLQRQICLFPAKEHHYIKGVLFNVELGSGMVVVTQLNNQLLYLSLQEIWKSNYLMDIHRLWLFLHCHGYVIFQHTLH